MNEKGETIQSTNNPPEQKNASGSRIPLSETIQNAHSAGDGSIGRNKDSLMETEEDDRERISDNNINQSQRY